MSVRSDRNTQLLQNNQYNDLEIIFSNYKDIANKIVIDQVPGKKAYNFIQKYRTIPFDSEFIKQPPQSALNDDEYCDEEK